jgi:hypothetical protein
MNLTVKQIRGKSVRELKSLAKKFQLQINPNDYKNSKTKLPFLCLVCVYKGTKSLELLKISTLGCKKCASRIGSSKQKLSPKKIVADALTSGIKITLNTYSNVSQKVACTCLKCNHGWTTSICCIRSGRGCPKCRRKQAAKKNSLAEDEIKRRLKKLGVTLLSPYINNHEKINIQFKKCGHSRWVAWNQIQQGQGCGDCAPNKKLDPDEYEAIAKRFGGKLISNPSTVREKLLWECSEGHRFRRSISPMQRLNTFCTKCNDGWGETLCRKVLEEAFGKPFDRARPQDLLSPKGIPIELDCYNEELALALEHQGMHHFKRQPNWQSVDQFKLCQKHDKIKRKYCTKKGILLVEIKEVGSITPPEIVPQIIDEQIKAGGRISPIGLKNIIPLSFKLKSRRSQYVDKAIQSAAILGFEILDKPKLADQKVRVRCKNGHETQKTLRAIIGGKKCYSCTFHNKVKLSDGRVFESGTAAATALGVTKEWVNRSIRKGIKIKGISLVRL